MMLFKKSQISDAKRNLNTHKTDIIKQETSQMCFMLIIDGKGWWKK